jgi:hypothetical protein
VATVTIEHFPAGTTEWEARAYERSQIEKGTRYNRTDNPYRTIAEQREQASREEDQRRRDQALALHEQHDGLTRVVTPEPHPGFPAGPLDTPRPAGGGPAGGRPASGPLTVALPRAQPIRNRTDPPGNRRVGGRGRDHAAGVLEHRGGWALLLLVGMVLGLALLAVAYYVLPPR